MDVQMGLDQEEAVSIESVWDEYSRPSSFPCTSTTDKDFLLMMSFIVE